MAFYERHYRRGLDHQNAKHLKRGQKARVMDMEKYHGNVKSAPEEDLYQIGSRKDGDVGGRLLLEIALKQFAWEAEEFPRVRTLDVALHLENGAWHIHRRKSWVGRDDAGNEIPDQGSALELMGVPRWNEDAYQADMMAAEQLTDEKERKKRIKNINRYNNRKMTYTAACREHFQQLCREYGLEIVTEPREKGKSGRTQAAYITEQLQEQVTTLTAQKEALEKEVAALKGDAGLVEQARKDGYKQGFADGQYSIQYPSQWRLKQLSGKVEIDEAEQRKRDALLKDILG